MKRLIVSLLLAMLPLSAQAADSVAPNAFSCFRNSTKDALVLRVEWVKEKRFALFAWPAGKTLRVHVGAGTDEVRWCWAKALGDVSGACAEGNKKWVVRNNCN